ncbi:MAG: DUF2723 domain-containing protein [Lentisphaerae bacterium]|nr:DUF2723 domain-containing protein [Lentisphaerota bacterium]
MAVYTYSLAPTVTLEDSGELVVAADYLGVPHPPGYPLWTILGWIFKWLFHFKDYMGQPNPAWGVNFMSGFFGALTCGVTALLISRSGLSLLRTLRQQSDEGPANRMDKLICWASGVGAGLVLAFSPFLWSQCTIAEVYSLNACLHILILTLAYVWMRRPHQTKLLYGMAFLFGLTFTNCQPIVLMAPAIGLMFFVADRRLFRDCLCVGLILLAGLVFFKTLEPEWSGADPLPNKELRILAGLGLLLSPLGIWIFTRQLFTEWRRVLLMVLYAMLGLSLFIYMPIASDANPPMNWGYPRTMEGFKHAVTRGQYQALTPALKPVEAFNQIVEFISELEDQFPFPMPLLALIPIFYFRRIWRQHWAWLLGLILAFAVTGPGMMILLNPPHDLQSLFIAKVQFVQSTAIYAVWTGYGFLLSLAFLDRLVKARALVYLGLSLTLLSPLALIWQDRYDEDLIARNGTSNLRGHDFGWQFGNYQLRGVQAILEELAPGAPPPPSAHFPPEMTPNAVFFGGTDPGRFVPTYMIYSAQVRPDVFLITQNALADNTYMNIMRDLYGDRIWLPSAQDVNLAFQSYINDVRAGRIIPNAAINVDKNGRVSVQGVQGVMEINGIICKMIFEANKARHDFYVEESYVINWMYPYLEPHGLIMKINKEPLPKLSAEMIQNDTAFWNWYSESLLQNPLFQRDVVARKSFSKLRCAIAGLYGARRLFTEAEAAFQQAVAMFPASPEANFRLAELYLQYGQFAQAHQVIATNLDLDPKNEKTLSFLNQIKDMEKTNARIVALQQQLSQSGGTLDMALELALLYQRTGQEQPFQELAQQILNSSNLPLQAYLRLAEMAASGRGHLPLMIEAFQRYLQYEPSDARIWLELAGAQVISGASNAGWQALQQAIALGGEPIKDAARRDARFEALRQLETFQRLVAPAQRHFAPFSSGGYIP